MAFKVILVSETVDLIKTFFLSLLSKGLGDPPSDLSSSARQRKPASGGGGSRSGGVRGSAAASPSSNARYIQDNVAAIYMKFTCVSVKIYSSCNSHD